MKTEMPPNEYSSKQVKPTPETAPRPDEAAATQAAVTAGQAAGAEPGASSGLQPDDTKGG